MAPSPHDICECGDYRSQHDLLGCVICRERTAPWDHCGRFRLCQIAPSTKAVN